MKGLYFHFPYCIHKCSYCDFYSIAKRTASDCFLNAVNSEINLYTYDNKPGIDTLFFGGGTPSLLTDIQFTELTSKIKESFDIDENYEFTLECNPGAVDMQNITHFKEKGVNRISMGIQSFNKDELAFLERIHSPEEALNSYKIIRDAGFDNVSVDLIFSIPGQTKETFSDTIEKVIELGVEHISAYSLIYEPGTPLYIEYKKGSFNALNQDEDTELYDLLVEKLISAGYIQYEVSNFAKPGRMCKHNLKYWHSEEYYGIGPSAHGFLNGRRYWNVKNIRKYVQLLDNNTFPEEGFEVLSGNDILHEKIFLAMRADGLNLNNYNQEHIFHHSDFIELIREYQRQGLLTFISGIIKLTSKGYFLGDELTVRIISILDKIQKKR